MKKKKKKGEHTVNKQWSYGEEIFIRNNMGEMTDRELLTKLQKINPSHKLSLDVVRKKRQRMLMIRKGKGE